MQNILFVDDDKVTLKMVESILTAAGYYVATTTDAMSVVERLEKEHFDLLITDANMPLLSGFDLIRTIRMHEKLAHIPITLLTGRREKKDIQMAINSGADEYIVKPIDPVIFIGKVEGLLKKFSPASKSQFPEGPVRAEAKFDHQVEITYVSERGLTLASNFTAPVNSKIKVQSEFFNRIGIEPPTLRIIGTSVDNTNAARTLMSTSFIGLTDNELQKIRQFLNTTFQKAKAG
ncbi:MAG: response regulator transcription factor [Oligoflexia bacterium]|nr:response regulator transcription factor [Oligoflexia bacterium]